MHYSSAEQPSGTCICCTLTTAHNLSALPASPLDVSRPQPRTHVPHVCRCLPQPLQEASGVLGEVAELTAQNQALNKTFMALAGACAAAPARQYDRRQAWVV